MHQNLLAAFAAIGMLVPASRAQAPLAFDVATIKPSRPDVVGTRLFIKPGGGLDAEGLTLKQLITTSYNVRDFQVIGGPSWLGSERFDIQARTASSDAPEYKSLSNAQREELERQFKQRIRSLLADRFHLVVRNEIKDMPTYQLIQTKTGSKLETADPDPAGNVGMSMGRGNITGSSAPIELLTRSLADVVGRPVIDKTGLQGKFNWKLEWTPDPGPAKPGAPADVAPADTLGPSVFAAIQEQLGLKLESTKGSAPVLIVEKADRPSAN